MLVLKEEVEEAGRGGERRRVGSGGGGEERPSCNIRRAPDRVFHVAAASKQ